VDDPKIVVVVVIDAPAGEEYYGGEVAAPVFARIASGAMRLMNVMPTRSEHYVVRAPSAARGEG
jgi:cell division protein FtsI (penicillin-binding protein 3)